MKAGKIFTSNLKSLLIVSLFILPTLSFSQTGKVWTSIQDINGLAITVGADKRVSSQIAELNTLIAGLQIKTIERAFPASHSRELSTVYEISCNCDENDLLQQISSKAKFFQNPEIAPTYTTLDTPNDYSTTFTNDYALELINAEAAWDITHGDSSIVLAITDANYYYYHEELIGKYNYITPNNTNSDYVHGTATSITAAGNTNNMLGKSSIGYNSTLQLRAMNFNEVLAASYAGARVVNMSWASGCYLSTYSQQVIDEAYGNGTILVASAGNGNTCGGANNLVYPAAYNQVISVSSVGPYNNHERSMGNPTTTHQHNSSVDLCAPGYDVALSIGPGSYMTGNGSSFAAPFVTGTIGLMLAVNPCLTSDEVEYILKATAVNIDAMNPAYAGKLGAGSLDAGAAVLMASTFSTMLLTAENTFSCATMEQGIELDLSTVTAPYQITWSNGSTAQNLVNVNPGTYSAIVRDSSGCVGYYETVIDTLVPITITADIYAVLCNGDNSGNIEIQANGGHSNYTYLWSNGATTQNAYNLTAGIHTVVVTDEKGCSITEEFSVNEPTALVATSNHQNVTMTHAGSIDVSVAGGTLPYSFTWSNGQVSEDLNGLATGFYEVLITDAKGCMASANAVVNSELLVGITGNTIVTDVRNDRDENFNFENLTASKTEESSSLNVFENENTSIAIYPNPATDFTTVTWEGVAISSVQLYDMTGKIIQTLDIEEYMTNIRINGVTRGEYMVKLISIDGAQLVKKVSFL